MDSVILNLMKIVDFIKRNKYETERCVYAPRSGALGAEAWKRAIERQVEILKEMGCNSIRVTHNPAAEELINICNEKGILVVEEMFDGWQNAKNGNNNDYADFSIRQ